MTPLSNLIQTADWKNEKHVPVIEAPESVQAGTPFQVKASLGKEIDHPNTTEHHIRWINLYFQPEGSGNVYEVGRFAFQAHGESPAGANEGPVHAHHSVTAELKVNKGGTLLAVAYCNIHGLWQGQADIKVG